MTGDISEHLLIFIYGPGGNGKTVFVNTIGGILGNYHTAAPNGDIHKKPAASDIRPTLPGYAEHGWSQVRKPTKGERGPKRVSKHITGGDPISARFMRQDFFTYSPRIRCSSSAIINRSCATLLMPCDVGWPWSRFLTSRKWWTRSWKKSFRLNGPVFYGGWWRDCLKWQADGVEQPGVVLAMTAEYFEEQDLFGQW